MSDHCVHCDPLCRGNDKNPHSCGTAMWDQGECVGCRERGAIVAWLEDAKRGDLSGLYLASFIARGDHLRSDNE